jgi:hypothetical protein
MTRLDKTGQGGGSLTAHDSSIPNRGTAANLDVADHTGAGRHKHAVTQLRPLARKSLQTLRFVHCKGAQEAVSVPERQAARRLSSIAAFGGLAGALTCLLVRQAALHAAAQALQRLAQAPQHRAQAPGQGCHRDGAPWTLPATM